MKIALAQLNPTVGDLAGNSQKILRAIDQARQAGARLVVLPELAVTGYPPKDLLLKPSFVRANQEAVHQLARECRDIAALIGFVEPNRESGRCLRNSAAFCVDRQVRSVHWKSLLPTYDVFDERRYFEPGPGRDVIEVDDWKIGVTICEDLWNDDQFIGRRLYDEDPIGRLASLGAKLFINLSASPFWVDKQRFREGLFQSHARRHHIPILVVNQVGGNDELIFDGASVAFDREGRLRARAKAFAEDLLLADPGNLGEGRIEPYPESDASVYQALLLGLRDYVSKCDFREVVVGLSGGIDSAVTAALAATALAPHAVHGVAMPSRFSSPQSISDSRQLAENLGIDFRIVPIGRIHECYEQELAGSFAGRPPDVTEENIQARIRGNILMALSNKFGWLLLSTGNKSELAVGYCTLYGDMSGGLAAISDVPKTTVYKLAEHINALHGRPVIPEPIMTKVPSAELRPGQTDQDSLPPYEVLDAILEGYVEQERSSDDLVAEGFDPALVGEVLRMVDRNEYKRKQAPPGLKVTSRAFGFGRRMPIAARYR